jgi:drug/metabolite transporter (DMT)-like permease
LNLPEAGLDRSVIDMAIASVLFFCMALCVKVLTTLPTSEVVLFRAVFAIILGYFMNRASGAPFFGNHRRLLVTRGFFGTFSLIGYFHSLHHLPLATAVTVQQLSPVFSTILAVAFLKEKVGLWQWIYCAGAFAGVVLVNGFVLGDSTLDLAIGTASALSAAAAYTSISMIRDREHPLTIVFYFPLITVPIILPFAIADWVTPNAQEWFFLALVGIFVQSAQYFMTKAFQFGKTSRVGIVSYLSIVLSVISGYILYAEALSFQTMAGIGLIVVSVFLNTAYPAP